MNQGQSRRAFLGALASAVGGGLAGCQSPGSVGDPATDGEFGLNTPDDQTTDPNGDGAAPEGPYSAVYHGAADSVASVRVYDGAGNGGQGSAFVYDEDHLVTNEHVVSSASSVYVRFRSTGWREVSVVGTDVYSDLAALRIDDLPEAATPLSFVEEEPPVGTEVVAIGNPFGLSGSVSTGVVSGVDRTLRAANNFSIPDTVQTDAAVNPGNSGGPLVTLDGRVAGVINAGGGDNIGFAISAALTERVVPALIDRGEYEHTYVGVRLQDVTPRIAEVNTIPGARGVYIDEVIAGSPADGVFRGSTGARSVNGVEVPVGGDVVVGMEGTQIPARQSLSSFLALHTRPGDTIDVEVIRDGERQTVALTLGERPDPN